MQDQLHPYLEAQDFKVSITLNEESLPDLRDLSASVEHWTFEPDPDYVYDDQEPDYEEDEEDDNDGDLEPGSEFPEDVDDLVGDLGKGSYAPIGTLTLDHSVNFNTIQQLNHILESEHPVIVTITLDAFGTSVARHTFIAAPQDCPQPISGSRSSAGPLIASLVLDVYEMKTWELV